MTARLSEQVHSTEGESSCDDRASLPSTLTDLINRLHNSATKATRLGNQHRHFAADLLLLGEQLHEFAAWPTGDTRPGIPAAERDKR